MSKELTCKDCGHLRGDQCSAHNGAMRFPDNPFCLDFCGRDGSRPRFCRLASSVDEMAEAISELLMTATLEQIKADGFKPVVTATKKQEYLVGIKAWLMEAEK